MLGSLQASGEGLREGKKLSLPSFLPLPLREFPFAGESVVNQPINHSTSLFLTWMPQILYCYLIGGDYPLAGYLVLTDVI